MTELPNTMSDSDALEVIEGMLNYGLKQDRTIEKLNSALEESQHRLDRLILSITGVPGRKPRPEVREGVLIVDPSDHIRRNLINLLDNNGFSIAGKASNGLRALQVLNETKPLAVTMELDLPVLDGYETIRQMTRMDPEAKVVVISDQLTESSIVSALSSGAVAVLAKPIAVDRFLKLISSLCTQPAHQNGVAAQKDT